MLNSTLKMCNYVLVLFNSQLNRTILLELVVISKRQLEEAGKFPPKRMIKIDTCNAYK
jgi:hypothetical protein